MSTRLTKEARQEIVDSVMAATNINDRRDEIENETRALAAQLVRDAQPPEWFPLIKGRPKDWFKLCQKIFVEAKSNPLEALKGNDHYYGRYIDFNDPIPVAVELVVDGAVEEKFAKLLARANAWYEEDLRVRGELMAFLNSCQTVEKALERMPELAPHVPKKAKAFPLVAPSNVLSSLTKMGFDRTVKEAA